MSLVNPRSFCTRFLRTMMRQRYFCAIRIPPLPDPRTALPLSTATMHLRPNSRDSTTTPTRIEKRTSTNCSMQSDTRKACGLSPASAGCGTKLQTSTEIATYPTVDEPSFPAGLSEEVVLRQVPIMGERDVHGRTNDAVAGKLRVAKCP